MNCAYARCSCKPADCEGKRSRAPVKPWKKYCCEGCGNRARMARYYRRRTAKNAR